jgi:hypothetical protein
MKQQVKRPNIFRISTKELSQDAFITWLLQWANPGCAELDPVLHQCGKQFLSLVIGDAPEREKEILDIEAGRQLDYVDIWAKILFSDGTKTLLVIEDKTFSGEHSNQLERYKKQAEDYCATEGFNLICTYFKIGSEPMRDIHAIRDKGFHIVTRKEIIACLQPYRDAEHSILRDFIEYIDDLEAAHLAFEKLPLKDWKDLAWVGFYQYIEANIKINWWHYVNNPSGGFWNLCLTWDYWNKQIPVYMQIEQHKLCFKIALGEDETDLDNTATDLNALQDFVHDALMKFAATRDEKDSVQRPTSMVHRGNYRTFAVIQLPNWYGSEDAIVDKQHVLVRLEKIISFYHEFLAELNKVSFETTGIKMLKQ